MAPRILFGLGNPGEAYAGTRHNLGFRVVDRVAEILEVRLEAAGSVYLGTAAREDFAVVLVKPMTYVNRSGGAAVEVLERFQTVPANLLVAIDDMSLELGQIRVRAKGSDGGHNGLRSIIDALGTEAFPRVRIGIGPAANGDAAVDETTVGEPREAREHVLGRFLPEEREPVEQSLVRAAEAAVRWLGRNGIQEIMSEYNRKPGGPRENEGARPEPCSDGES